MHPHFLADQLTLSQPGGHIIPSQYYVPLRFLDLRRPCNVFPARQHVLAIEQGNLLRGKPLEEREFQSSE